MYLPDFPQVLAQDRGDVDLDGVDHLGLQRAVHLAVGQADGIRADGLPDRLVQRHAEDARLETRAKSAVVLTGALTVRKLRWPMSAT
jgi:hypothetical protein